MSALDIFRYQDHEVRTISIDGEPWFVLADLAKVLGIADTQRLNSRLDHGVRQAHPISDRLGRRQLATVVNEAGMYEVVIRSDKPEAAAFRRWVTHEVIPTIRKTGSYGVQHALPQTFAEALRQLADTAEANEALTAKVEADAPKVDYIDTFVADDDLRLFRNVAKSLGIGEEKLRAALIEHKWIYVENSSRWSEKQNKRVPQTRYSAYADKTRYFTPRPDHEAPRFRGEVDHTLKITPEGAVAIAKQARIWGLVPRGEA